MGDYTHWHVGMKVVCVNPRAASDGVAAIDEGRIYTIRSIFLRYKNYGEVGVRLVEIENGVDPYWHAEYGYAASRFRIAQARATDISIFTAMLVNPPKELAYTVPNRPFE